jgi:division protein CdvB (Snf7/Vps24/ESCRT-III family)
MGTLKNFIGWLSEGKGDSKDGVSRSIMKMKLLVKRLARQVGKMEVQAKILRNKAIKSREAGDMEGSKLSMKSSLQYKKWAHSTETFRVKLEGIQYKLEQAKAMKDFSGVAQEVAKVMSGLVMDVKAPQIAEILKDMDLSFESMDNVMEMTNENLEVMDAGSSTAVKEEEVDNALAEIDAEISIKRGVDLPSAPIAGTEPAIDSLEDEIKRLKQQRT